MSFSITQDLQIDAQVFFYEFVGLFQEIMLELQLADIDRAEGRQGAAQVLNVQVLWGWLCSVSWMKEPHDRVADSFSCTMSALRRPVGQRPVERFRLHHIAR